MEPKEMTNEQLISAHYDSARRAGIQTGLVRSMESRAIEYERREAIEAELLRRLNEADALRKENEELRNAHAKLLKDYAELRVNSALLVACDDALESLDSSEASRPETKCASLSEEIDRIKSEGGRAK